MPTTTTTTSASPRRAGDPAPDLLGITAAHRVMLADLLRLSDLAAAVRDRDVICTPGRARSISRYIESLCDSIHHHHTTEDAALWPVIQASVGDHVDLSELIEDHTALAPRLDQLRARAAAFRLSMGDRHIAGLMAIELTELAALLTEHINDEEMEVFPLITEHVSVADWATVEKAARAGRMSFDAPRAAAVMTDDERAESAQHNGIGLRILLVGLTALYRRRERAVFGAAGVSR
ncbi:hemerythrin domain-containing protein [Mycolicibacterium lutetiense]|uniref:Hemerythrin-like domain-containing protein n=1 Tax=Mycolicibacterium lutetiense TaxID=1641992 RepID=A0ABS5A155_9MYCO|nr:hemerythrin domain-containing protein [Mycolicibacterium lutetiense]MBP2455488.1 hemerythrin-like domain-containing protein [Mycolicibacterium lutetiense]